MANLLVVDDEMDVALPVVTFLELEGYTVRYAASGEAGLSAIDERLPELILLDIEMPKLSGPELAYRLLILDSGKEKIPILVLSGVANLAEVAETIGTPYYMAKPFRFDRLKALVEQALAERRPPEPSGMRSASS